MDDSDQPQGAATENPGLADLLNQFGSAVQRGEQTNLSDPVWLERFNSVLALQQSGHGNLPSASAQTSSVEVVRAEILNATTNERLAEVEETLKNFRFARVMDEVSNRTLQLERRERDKGIRIGMFKTEQAKQHAADLFDTQACLDDLTDDLT